MILNLFSNLFLMNVLELDNLSNVIFIKYVPTLKGHALKKKENRHYPVLPLINFFQLLIHINLSQ